MDNAVEAWCEHMRARGLSPNTLRRRTVALGRLARWVAPAPILEAGASDVDGWLASQTSQWTRYSYYRDAEGFFRWAVRRRLVSESPLAEVDPPPLGTQLPRPLTREQLELVLAEAVGDVRIMVLLGAYAGLRVSEIAGLHSDDVHLHGERPILVVRQGKGRKDRVVPLHPVLQAALSLRRGWVVQRMDGGRYRPATITVKIGRHFDACGVAATSHALRHSFASAAAKASNGNVIAVASLLGHSSTNTSMGYIRLVGDHAGVVAALYD